MTQEELGALGRRAHEVRAPVQQDAREVDGIVWILRREAHVAIAELFDDVVLDAHALGVCFVLEQQRVAIPLREGRHPSAAH